MYSKAYKIICDPQQREALMTYYDENVADVVRQSPHHVSHQMIEVTESQYLLLSNYNSKQDAEKSLHIVQEIVAPMIENFGMTLEPIAEGETIREIS